MTPPLKTRDVISNLTHKGFVRLDGDHTYLIYSINGNNTSIRTKISHGCSEIGQPLISKMAKQIKLNTNQFIRFSRCEISEEGYRTILNRNGHL